MTFADLDALLTRALTFATNPAILRLPEADRTVEGLARAYHTRRVFWLRSDGAIDETCHVNTVSALRGWSVLRSTELDLTDAGTVGAVKTALGLALGLDPGDAALGCMWERAGQCWMLTTTDASLAFEPEDVGHGIAAGDVTVSCLSWVCAPQIAMENDSVKALVLAVRRVLGVA